MNAIFLFQTDLRLEDNHALYQALSENKQVIPMFLLPQKRSLSEARRTYLHQEINRLQTKLRCLGSELFLGEENDFSTIAQICEHYNVGRLYTNQQVHPESELKTQQLANDLDLKYHAYWDHLMIPPGQITTDSGTPYRVFTPFFHKWRSHLDQWMDNYYPSENLTDHFIKHEAIPFTSWGTLNTSHFEVPKINLERSLLESYEYQRDFPALNRTTHLSAHLSLGTISIRNTVRKLRLVETVLRELAWREFFAHLLYHFPESATQPFKTKYQHLNWEENPSYLAAWQQGSTGFPIIDAGMRELNTTGLMHNRVRMIVASFFCKHLRLDWRIGEQYFAKHLLDYDPASNIGNWQWSAGTGCDTSPFLRIFNPINQQVKFDPKMEYIRKWVPEVDTPAYVPQIIDLKEERRRSLAFFKQAV